MRSAVPPNPPDFDRHIGQAFFWIREIDERGMPVDMRFADAAYRKAEHLSRYRANELRDQAVRAELVEAAVYRASRANKENPILDAGGYVFRVFKRLVDERLSREKLISTHESDSLDRLGALRASSPLIEDEILTREILSAMDAETRWVWERRLLGYEVQEIAAELNITADCLSTRLRRGLRDVIGKLLRPGPNARQ